MSALNRYEIDQTQRGILRRLSGATICLVQAGALQLRKNGLEGVGLIAVVTPLDGEEVLLFGLPAWGSTRAFPTIHVEMIGNYVGEWVSEVGKRQCLEECLQASGVRENTLHVTDVWIIRDQITWKARVDGTETTYSTECGIQFGLSNGASLLILAKDSELGIMQFVYTTVPSEMSWWFTDSGIRRNWFVYDDDPESVDVMSDSERNRWAV